MAQVAGCWERQSLRAPLYTFVDQGHGSLGAKRNNLVVATIQAAGLKSQDWMVMIDDDDHYAPWHVETIAAAIQQRPQAGIVAPPCYGTLRPNGQLSRVALTRGAPPWLTIHDPGPGPHAGVAVRVGAWAQTGGYREDGMPEDVPMLDAARRVCGVVYSSRASYIHRRDGGDHRVDGVLQPRVRLPDVPPADTCYSRQQRAWDAALASW